MQEVFKKIAAVAGSDASVLLIGESGTGKELLARAVHYNSARSGAPSRRSTARHPRDARWE